MSQRPASSPAPPAGRSIPRARRMIIACGGMAVFLAAASVLAPAASATPPPPEPSVAPVPSPRRSPPRLRTSRCGPSRRWWLQPLSRPPPARFSPCRWNTCAGTAGNQRPRPKPHPGRANLRRQHPKPGQAEILSSDPQTAGPARPRHRGDHHAPVPYESHPRRRTTSRRAGPPVPGGAAGPRAAGPARGLRPSGQATGPPAVPPDNRLVQQAHAPGGHMPAGSTRLSSRHGMKSWRTDDESSRGTDLTATRTELNNMSASGAAPFRKHGRKYSAGVGAPSTAT